MNQDGWSLQIDIDGLKSYGENMARQLKLTGFKSPMALRKSLFEQLHCLEAAAEGSSDLWLSDNFYLIRRQGQGAAKNLQQSKPLAWGMDAPALFELCQALVRSGGGEVSVARCLEFFRGCQLVYVLSSRELSLLISLLKAAVISELYACYCLPGPGCQAQKLFRSLSLLATQDFGLMLNQIDQLEQLLSDDPAGTYPLMCQKTKNYYKSLVEKLARRHRLPAAQIAGQLLSLARASQGAKRHIGLHLYESAKKAPPNGGGYLVFLGLTTALVCGATALGLSNFWVLLLLALPVFSIVKSVTDLIILQIIRPSHIPRLELKDGVPAEGRTICVISALLCSPDSGEKLARRLEEFRLASRDCGKNLLFGILADLPDSPSETAPADKAIVCSALSAIEALNKKYGGGFFLLLRPRSYNSRDGIYMGRERKRGAIMELSRLLEGRKTELNCLCANRSSLDDTRYILTLDEDTVLTPGSAKELIAAMLHPLNTPVLDEKRGLVTAGHGLIHPRIANEIAACNRSAFARIFAGQGGSDPYGSDSSELYMDLFQRGGFAGKGIINAGVLLKCMELHAPENRILSHDAPEGAYLRGGYLGDVELLDGFPHNAFSYFRRLHRWTRGDFQNAGFIFRRSSGLPLIERFRMLDSLRRGLLPPLSFLYFVLAFFLNSKALTAAGIAALLALSAGLLSPCLHHLFQKAENAKILTHSPVIPQPNLSLMQTLLALSLLPLEATVTAGAALCAIWRVNVSRRRLLDWMPASALGGIAETPLAAYGVMWFPVLLSLIILLFASSILGRAVAFLWIFSPLLALSLSQTTPKPKPPSSENRAFLLDCAGRIWSYFTDFCTPEHNFLPPDNFQFQPYTGVAPRSSPTNIGLCLASCLAALDLKLCDPKIPLGLIENLLATVDALPKWNGHLYNWYDTRTAQPMPPAFISTVDSGNLAACLLILHHGLLEYGASNLAQISHKLYQAMDFSTLYQPEKQLLATGFDLQTGRLTESFYDLLASEARSASFIAVAKGEVPRSHYKKLGRSQLQAGSHCGLASWTGTMFEYLMPRLFFKSEPCSLMYESLAFALGTQKAEAAKAGLPWGVSECAYASLTSDRSYHYKAHGCQALAIKLDKNQGMVISPYSSFLALCGGTAPVVKNLKSLKKLGADCKYGFWEAIDFSSGQPEIVRCVMAHHLGMSLLAIANALEEDLNPTRLLREPSMSAFSCLLNEKLPPCSPMINHPRQKTQ